MTWFPLDASSLLSHPQPSCLHQQLWFLVVLSFFHCTQSLLFLNVIAISASVILLLNSPQISSLLDSESSKEEILAFILHLNMLLHPSWFLANANHHCNSCLHSPSLPSPSSPCASQITAAGQTTDHTILHKHQYLVLCYISVTLSIFMLLSCCFLLAMCQVPTIIANCCMLQRRCYYY